jgi:hypothetical protein
MEERLPLVVPVEPLIPRNHPAFLAAHCDGAAAGACIVLPWVLVDGLEEVVEKARRELALLGERKEKDWVV